MIAVITGDIIQSRAASSPDDWMGQVKESLAHYGKTPYDWDIFRGDSFQVATEPKESLSAAVRLKATVKSIPKLDVRMAIGIGDKTYSGKGISESSGSAHIRSGEAFESLKDQKKTLVFSSPYKELDAEINTIITLLLVILDGWSTVSAQTAKLVLANPNRQQQSLANALNIRQSSVSARYHRAHLTEVLDALQYFENRLINLKQST